MYATQTPSSVIARELADPQLPRGVGERFVLDGVMGLAFTSGHYLALRDIAASSIGPTYRSVWHRDPSGAWTMLTTVDPELSCPRYFGAALTRAEVVDRVDLTWTDAHTLRVRVGDRLDWSVELGHTLATRLMSRMAAGLPAWAWRNEAVVGGVETMAGPMLRAGRMRLRGQTPNGQHFRAAPARVWRVTSSFAVLDGLHLGRVGPLAQQARLGDFWLPQRGIFLVGTAIFSSRKRMYPSPPLKR